MGRFRSTALLTAATFLCHLLAFLNNVFISKYFGTSVQLDGFWLGMLVVTTLAIYMEPFTEVAGLRVKALELDDVAASHRTLSGLINLLLLGGGVIMVSAYLVLPHAVRWFTPKDYAGGVEMVKPFALVLLPLCVIQPLARLLEGYLTVQRRFLAPKFALMAGVLAGLAAIILLHATWAIYAIAAVFYLRFLVQLGGMIAALKRTRFRYCLTLRVEGWRAALPHFGTLMLVQLASIAVTIVFQKALSASMEGGLSAYNYAFRVWSLPLTFLAASVASVMWPEMIEAAHVDLNRLWEEFYFPMRLMLAALFGIGILFFCFAEPIIYILFERGEFTPESTRTTALCLRILALGLPFWGLISLCGRGMVIRGMNRTFLVVGILHVAVVVAAIMMIQAQYMSIGNLVTAFVGGNVLASLMYTSYFYLGSGLSRYARLVFYIIRIALASAIVIGLYIMFPHAAQLSRNTNKLSTLIHISLISTLICAAYISLLYVFGERKVVTFAIHKFGRRLLPQKYFDGPVGRP